MEKKNQSEERLKKLQQLISRIHICINYTSAYDEKFDMRTKSIKVQEANGTDLVNSVAHP